jgi:hypothetical protein
MSVYVRRYGVHSQSFIFDPHHSLAHTYDARENAKNSPIVLACIGMAPGFQRGAFSFLRHYRYRYGRVHRPAMIMAWVDESFCEAKAPRRRT